MWYLLDANHEPVPEPDWFKVARFMESSERIVLQHEIGECFVSTVFLCIDHNFGGDKPVLFETLVYGGPLDDHMERYTTWSDAVAGHMGILRVLAEQLGKSVTDVLQNIPSTPKPHRRSLYERLLEEED